MKRISKILNLILSILIVLTLLSSFAGIGFNDPIIEDASADKAVGLSMIDRNDCCVCELLGGVCEVSDQCCVSWGDCDYPNCGLD
ncbi:MAG: hypothetical protein R6V34_01700 [Bacteroidales bacterium]